MAAAGGRIHLEHGLLEVIVNALPEAVEIDRIDGSILFVNDAWRGMFDRRERDVTGANWESIFSGAPRTIKG